MIQALLSLFVTLMTIGINFLSHVSTNSPFPETLYDFGLMFVVYYVVFYVVIRFLTGAFIRD